MAGDAEPHKNLTRRSGRACRTCHLPVLHGVGFSRGAGIDHLPTHQRRLQMYIGGGALLIIIIILLLIFFL